MAAPKRATHRVVKEGLYFSPKDGELEVGTQVTLTTEQAEKLEARGMVVSLKDIKTVDASETDSKALNAMKDELKAKDKELADVQKELEETKKALNAVGAPKA